MSIECCPYVDYRSGMFVMIGLTVFGLSYVRPERSKSLSLSIMLFSTGNKQFEAAISRWRGNLPLDFQFT